MTQVPDIVIITGLSGSGMSSATNAFQDLGYFCVDNLPVTMLPTFGRLVSNDDDEKGIRRAALVIDIREGQFLVDFEKQLDALRASGGTAIAVTDDELIAATKEIGAAEGIFCAPEGAACLPALKKMMKDGSVEPDERVVLFNTGTGVKYR